MNHMQDLSPKYIADLAKKVSNTIWDNYKSYDMVKFYEADADVVEAKEQLILAMERKLSQQEEVPELIYRGISFLEYDLEWEAYERLTAELKNGK